MLKLHSIVVVAYCVIYFGAVVVMARPQINIENSENETEVNVIEKVINHKKKGPMSIMYVEVNDNNILNTGAYTLLGSGKPLFDIGIIFAANINYNVTSRKAVLYFNGNVTTILSNVNKYVRPLQAKGIKILLSILGNHQGAGISNFQNVESARDFAIQLSDAVKKYGLDGIDFDDEYAEYGNNGTGQPNPFSFVYLLRELRTLMPDKIISFYFYGPASYRLTYENLNAGDYLTYSWNAYYGTYFPPPVPKLQKNQLGPAAINVQSTGSGLAHDLAIRTVKEGYGIYLMYNLPNKNINSYLSSISQRLYGQGTTVSGALKSWP